MNNEEKTAGTEEKTFTISNCATCGCRIPVPVDRKDGMWFCYRCDELNQMRDHSLESLGMMRTAIMEGKGQTGILVDIKMQLERVATLLQDIEKNTRGGSK